MVTINVMRCSLDKWLHKVQSSIKYLSLSNMLRMAKIEHDYRSLQFVVTRVHIGHRNRKKE